MNQAGGERARRESGVAVKVSPGAYACTTVEEDAAAAEERIAGLKAYHEARHKLNRLAFELADAPARDLIPGVTSAYVETMRQCLQILLLNADVAEGL